MQIFSANASGLTFNLNTKGLKRSLFLLSFRLNINPHMIILTQLSTHQSSFLRIAVVLLCAWLASGAQTHAEYILKPNDQISMTVFQEPDMTTSVKLSKSGFVVLPLLGSIRLSGKTIEEAVKEITTALDKDYIINPHVTLTVTAYAKERITILGQVQKPGTLDIPDEGRLDLLGAIAMAGGYTDIANPSKVTLRRIVNAEEQVFVIDAKRLARDKKAKRVFIQPNDIITVGESFF